MKKRNEQFHNDPWDRDYYGTGSTQPPKNHGATVAVLLVAVIVLGSLTTYLGLMNIRLTQLLQLQEQEQENVQVLQPEGSTLDAQGTEETAARDGEGMLNVRCTTVTEFDVRFYGLPYGCLVTDTVEGGGADRAGICSGDVIVGFQGEAVANVEQLSKALSRCTVGQTVSVEIYRPETQKNMTLEVTLDERGENG